MGKRKKFKGTKGTKISSEKVITEEVKYDERKEEEMNKEKEKMDNTTPAITIGVTHSGNFHADDVFSSALLKIVFPDIRIMRLSPIPEAMIDKENIIIFDTGNGKYDHHNKSNKDVRPDGTPYASFGKLWRDFGHMVLEEPYDRTYIDNILVKQIDSTDNGGNPNPLTSAIKSFNSLWDDEDGSNEIQFNKAVEFAKTILQNYIRKKLSERKADNIIDEKMRLQRGPFLILDTYIPISPNIKEDVLFIIYPMKVSGYRLDAVIDKNTKYPRKSITQIKDATYVHPNGYFATFRDLQSAVAAAESLTDQNVIKDISIEKVVDVMNDKGWTIYDSRSKSEIEIYGIVKMNDIICPILEVDQPYSLSSLTVSEDESIGVILNDDYYGMVTNNRNERNDDRFAVVIYRPKIAA